MMTFSQAVQACKQDPAFGSADSWADFCRIARRALKRAGAVHSSAPGLVDRLAETLQAEWHCAMAAAEREAEEAADEDLDRDRVARLLVRK